MSQRIYIIGFDKEKLEGIYGSKNEDFKNELISKYDSDFDEVIQEEGEKEAAHKVIKEFVYGENDPREQEVTSDLFVELLRRYFVFYGQDILWTNMEHSDFYDYLKKVVLTIKDDEIKKLFEKLYFSAIFSDEDPMNTDHQYAFLSKEDVKKMNDYIRDNKKKFESKNELGKVFIESINQVEQFNKDLFLYAS